MLILDWTHPSLACGSLGNIIGVAYATEFIREELKVDVGVIPSYYHPDVWPLCIPENRIYSNIPFDAEVRICHPGNRKLKEELHWIQKPVVYAGFEMPDDYKINPRVCWLHLRNSRRVLMYPREYNNKNVYFTLEFWIEVGNLLLKNGWSIVALLDLQNSHRDGNVSVKWCNEFKQQVKCEYIFPPTIGGLQAAVGLSEVSVGIDNGPAWLMLKSTIRQIVFSNPFDPLIYCSGEYNFKFIKKHITHILGTSLDWISEL